MTKTARDLQFPREFSPSEWPEGVLKHMAQEPLKALFSLRKKTGKPAYPSPLKRGHIREESSTSSHSLKDFTRLSTATDFFVHREDALLWWAVIMEDIDVDGFGIYRWSRFKNSLDDFTMFHIDTPREGIEHKTVWVADRLRGESEFTYYSLNQSPQQYFETLSKSGFFK